MADKWMQEAFSKNKGALHKKLGVPVGKKIPEMKLDKAINSKSEKLRKEAELAKTAREIGAKRSGKKK